MGTKTPVSILQEMMVRKGLIPVYDLIHDGCGTHQALFKYQVHAGKVSAIGSGHSKKEAKHDAAKRVLERIHQEEEENEIPEPSLPEEAIGIESPYHNKMQENAVGQLQELCMQNNIVVPEYKLIGDEGPAHAKQFTILCQINNFQEVAVGRTKKQAKQLAALAMCNTLNSLVKDVPDSIKRQDTVNNVPDVKMEKLVERFKETSVTYNSQKVRLGMKIYDYTWELTNLGGEELRILKETELADIDDPQEKLQKIVDELGATVEYNHTATRENYTYGTLLQVLTTPDFVSWGLSNDSQAHADSKAAEKALEYLKIMT